MEALAAEHIHIARRTVTQYRRELQLPPAHRRQLHGSTAGASRLRTRNGGCARPLAPFAGGALPRRDDEAAGSLHPWVERIYGIDFARLAADPEGRAAYRDLQTALTHPSLRPAVLLALRAFAQAAQVGATTPRRRTPSSRCRAPRSGPMSRRSPPSTIPTIC